MEFSEKTKAEIKEELEARQRFLDRQPSIAKKRYDELYASVPVADFVHGYMIRDHTDEYRGNIPTEDKYFPVSSAISELKKISSQNIPGAQAKLDAIEALRQQVEAIYKKYMSIPPSHLPIQMDTGVDSRWLSEIEDMRRADIRPAVNIGNDIRSKGRYNDLWKEVEKVMDEHRKQEGLTPATHTAREISRQLTDGGKTITQQFATSPFVK